MDLTLYKLDASPPARAVMMVLDTLKAPYQPIDVYWQETDILKLVFLNFFFFIPLRPHEVVPRHTLPTLTDGDFMIWDSHAIASYLVSKYARNDLLYPRDSKMRAVVDQRLHFDTGILFPALRGAVAPVIFGGETGIRPENIEKLLEAYDFTEIFLDKPYLAGDKLTIADICAVATISSIDKVVPIDNAKYPKLASWLARMASEEFYQNANAPGVQQFGSLLKSKLE